MLLWIYLYFIGNLPHRVCLFIFQILRLTSTPVYRNTLNFNWWSLRCWRFRRKKKNVIKVKLSVCVHERKKVLKKWWKKEEEEFLLSFDTSANIHTCWEITVCGEQTQTTEILDSVKLLAFNLNTHSFLFDHIITRPDPEPLQHIKPHVFPIY